MLVCDEHLIISLYSFFFGLVPSRQRLSSYGVELASDSAVMAVGGRSDAGAEYLHTLWGALKVFAE